MIKSKAGSLMMSVRHTYYSCQNSLRILDGDIVFRRLVGRYFCRQPAQEEAENGEVVE